MRPHEQFTSEGLGKKVKEFVFLRSCKSLSVVPLFSDPSHLHSSPMTGRSVRYAVVDAFTTTPFKGNPAAVCLLVEEDEGIDKEWMQNVAMEFNISETAFLTSSASSTGSGGVSAFSVPRFRLQWFTPVAEVKLCGHATLASAHFLFSSGLAKSEVIEFDTLSGILTAKKVQGLKKSAFAEPYTNENEDSFSIELDFPIIQVVDCGPEEIPSLPETLNNLSIMNVQKTALGDLIIELASGKDLAEVKPNFIELERWDGRGVLLTAPAPPDSEFDFFSRFFCPKFGINEDPVCGSAHCALAPYWSRKFLKHNLIAYQASPRGGILDIEVDEQKNRVLIRGKAVTTMIGSLTA